MITWIATHGTTFWCLIFAVVIGYVLGRGANGNWRNWFDLGSDEE